MLSVFFCAVLCVNLIAGAIFAYLNISIGQHVQELIKKKEPRILLIATITAPICEEILFRGFVKERMEDLCTIFSKTVKPLSGLSVQVISNIGQAFIFGLAHRHKKQTDIANALIFCATTQIGFGLGCVKDYASTLVSPICLHATLNISVVSRLLIFGH